ncbi:hypothetical protein BDN70DRAFT_196264 [Pholiota conissans]|uniref:Uncharacterized protein n=1 Tax=Pholiota conissans TaxID=109636 RepID=A0A9P6CYH0_9AGAR|nr:hypothetical protein BDN70DRAFT_196264 [Pholiota conissans]
MPISSPLPSPMALSKASQSSSIFKKRSANPVLPADAASYLSALSQADASARARTGTSGASTISTPALSLSSSVTSSSEDTVLHEAEHLAELSNNADGLLLPLHPPTSEQVFTTVHTEFGHCANEAYRTTSQHKLGTPLEDHVEQDPPYYILLSTYISYLILIVLGHVRDFIGKRLSPASYHHLIPRDVSVFFWSYFYCEGRTYVKVLASPLPRDRERHYHAKLPALWREVFVTVIFMFLYAANYSHCACVGRQRLLSQLYCDFRHSATQATTAFYLH